MSGNVLDVGPGGPWLKLCASSGSPFIVVLSKSQFHCDMLMCGSRKVVYINNFICTVQSGNIAHL